MKRLVLTSFQSPGDVVLLTAAVRDLHVAHPGRFATDVRTSAPELWENNPPITPLDERARDVETIDMHYSLIHESNQRPFHFIRGYSQYLESRLGLRIPSRGSMATPICECEQAGWCHRHGCAKPPLFLDLCQRLPLSRSCRVESVGVRRPWGMHAGESPGGSGLLRAVR